MEQNLSIIRFLKRLLRELGRFVQRPQSQPIPQPAPNVEGNEVISRFLLNSRLFARTTGRVKYGAYMPNRNGETSIYRVSGITELEIWGIGDKYVREPIASKQGACVLQGWAEVNADIILDQSLTVIPKPRPHPRHADIMGWPNEKAEKQMLATEIANVANLHLPSI